MGLNRSRRLSAGGGGKNMGPLIVSALPLMILISSRSSSTFVSAQGSATIGPADGVITYADFEEQFAEINDLKPGNDFESCDGYPVAFAEEAFITLYGPGTEEPFDEQDGEIFIEILIETLNECTDPCVWIDDVEISEEELQKISVLALDFGDPFGRDKGRELWIEGEGNRTDIILADQEASVIEGLPLALVQDQQRQLQRRRGTKSRRIKKATMRGRKKKRSKNRMLQDVGFDDEPLLPPDNTCGVILMEKLALTGNPAFECLFSRGAFVTSCDPRDVTLLTVDERLEEDAAVAAAERAAIRKKRNKKRQQLKQQQQLLTAQSVEQP